MLRRRGEGEGRNEDTPQRAAPAVPPTVSQDTGEGERGKGNELAGKRGGLISNTPRRAKNREEGEEKKRRNPPPHLSPPPMNT